MHPSPRSPRTAIGVLPPNTIAWECNPRYIYVIWRPYQVPDRCFGFSLSMRACSNALNLNLTPGRHCLISGHALQHDTVQSLRAEVLHKLHSRSIA